MSTIISFTANHYKSKIFFHHFLLLKNQINTTNISETLQNWHTICEMVTDLKYSQDTIYKGIMAKIFKGGSSE